MQEVCVPGHVLLVTTDVALHSGVSSERRQVLVQFVCAASVFFLCRGEAFNRAKSSQSWCGQVPESLGPIESLAIGTCSIAVRHHSASSGLWRSLSNYDLDVVPEGMTWRGRTWHYAVQDVNTISYVVARQNLSLLFV